MIEIACDGDKKFVPSENDQHKVIHHLSQLTPYICAQTKYTHNKNAFLLFGLQQWRLHTHSGVCRDSNSAPVVDSVQARRLFILHIATLGASVCFIQMARIQTKPSLHAV
jgi:hypothetical protein